MSHDLGPLREKYPHTLWIVGQGPGPCLLWEDGPSEDEVVQLSGWDPNHTWRSLGYRNRLLGLSLIHLGEIEVASPPSMDAAFGMSPAQLASYINDPPTVLGDALKKWSKSKSGADMKSSVPDWVNERVEILQAVLKRDPDLIRAVGGPPTLGSKWLEIILESELGGIRERWDDAGLLLRDNTKPNA